MLAEDASNDEVRAAIERMVTDFRDKAPLTAAQAATIILDGVQSGSWRILVGYDAKFLDEQVRADPEHSYDYAELFKGSDSYPGAMSTKRL